MDEVIRACYSATDDLTTLRHRLLRTLNRAVPFDAAFFATADPDTLLFTSGFADDTLAAVAGHAVWTLTGSVPCPSGGVGR